MHLRVMFAANDTAAASIEYARRHKPL
jgi:hypothetical protein